MKKLCKILLVFAVFVFTFGVNICFLQSSENKVLADAERVQITSKDITDYQLYNKLSGMAASLFNSPYLYADTFADESFTEINLSNENIASLQGLELLQFPFVTKVDFSKNAIDTIPINAFFSMKNLETLNLSNNNLQTLEITSYASEINLNNNKLEQVTINDSNLTLINLNNNNFYNTNLINFNTGNKNEVLPENQFEILLYNNYLSGYDSVQGQKILNNAYLGVQGIKSTIVKSDSVLTVYPFKKINVLKSVLIDEDEQIYENQVKLSNVIVKLTTMPNNNGEYEVIHTFNPTSMVNYDSYVLTCGYFRLIFVDDYGDLIYSYYYDTSINPDTSLPYNEYKFELSTDDNYDGISQKVVNKNYETINLTIKPREQNVHLMHNGTVYAIDGNFKGPIKFEIFTTIKDDCYFLYSVNSKDFQRYNADEGIYIEKGGIYTIYLKVVQNGVESDPNVFLVRVQIPGKLSLKHYIAIAVAFVGLVAVLVLITKKNALQNKQTDNNEFEW